MSISSRGGRYSRISHFFVVVLFFLIAFTFPGCGGGSSSPTNPSVAPSIQAQPIDQSVTAGQTASFSVIASGTPPLTYQWQKNGVAIIGANGATYTTPSTVDSDDGSQFNVTVKNAAGSV